MRLRSLSIVGVTALLAALATGAAAKQVDPMYGGLLIDGYDFKNDIGPKGSIAFDEATGEFVGAYTGLKMPSGRRAIRILPAESAMTPTITSTIEESASAAVRSGDRGTV